MNFNGLFLATAHFQRSRMDLHAALGGIWDGKVVHQKKGLSGRCLDEGTSEADL